MTNTSVLRDYTLIAFAAEAAGFEFDNIDGTTLLGHPLLWKACGAPMASSWPVYREKDELIIDVSQDRLIRVPLDAPQDDVLAALMANLMNLYRESMELYG